MKKNITLIKIAIVVLFTTFSFVAMAQTATPFQGPSDASIAPPTSAAAVNKVMCAGGQVTLIGPADNTGNLIYQWYKADNAGAMKLVKAGTNKDNTYTETLTGAGYYTYQLVQLSSNSCTSEPSDLMKIYVLPPLNPQITASSATVCEKAISTSVLTITGLDSKLTYTYQWARNGTNITTGGTANTYTVAEQTAGTAIYTVKVACTLNAACAAATANKTITVSPIPSKPTIQL